jgi:DnaJ-domain-containing protein 1
MINTINKKIKEKQEQLTKIKSNIRAQKYYTEHKDHCKKVGKSYYERNKEILNQKRKLYKRQKWSERADNPKRGLTVA